MQDRIVIWLCFILMSSFAPASRAAAATESLAQALAELKVPPDWFNSTSVNWDTNKPWKDARLEIRRLLALDGASVRHGVKLTWLYAQKKDIGDGHELPMYLFMSGNYAWAAKEYPPYLQKVRGTGPTHAYQCYASALAHFGEHEKALTILDEATKDLPPAPWRISSLANVQEQLGDTRAAMSDIPKAKAHYTEAIRLLGISDQPYGRHLLPRHAAKIQAKLDLLTLDNMNLAALRQGTFTGKTLGYAESPEMQVTVTLAGGRISDVSVKHGEKIDLGATTIIPQRIIAKQSLKVDAVSGATVTSQAVVDGAFRALQQAGLK